MAAAEMGRELGPHQPERDPAAVRAWGRGGGGGGRNPDGDTGGEGRPASDGRRVEMERKPGGRDGERGGSGEDT